MADIREYSVQARSTDTFGRVLCNSRNHHFVVDGPAQNKCPGEAITPAELFLSGVAACGVELLQVLAGNLKIPLRHVRVKIQGKMDRENPVRPDVALFNSVYLQFELSGTTDPQASELIEAFKGR